MTHILVNRKGTAVLARVNDAIIWQDADIAESTNFKFAVRYPSADAAARGAAIYDADARELPQ